MARYLHFILVAVLVAGSLASDCLNSQSCPANHCCRDENNQVITNEMFGPFGPHLSGTVKGVCTPGRAQKGEHCDGTCSCDAGLECYRPMSGMCCPPMRCYDADYVKKQREYWSNCGKDPQCFFPA